VTRPTLAVAVAVLAGMVAAPAGQQPVFRGDTQIVPIYATVTDGRGQLVTDLVASDFDVLDNGKRQTLTLFKGDAQPITVAILVDRSPSLFPIAQRATSAVTEFVHRLTPGDRACLGTFSQTVSLDPTLSDDRDALLRHLNDDVPWPAGTAMWDALETARGALALEGGRRVILIVSDAADNCSRVDIDTTRTKLQDDGVLVYAVGVRGRERLDGSELGAIARATGGWNFELTSTADIAATAQRIADELHRQYALGFAPQNLDNKRHRIEVKSTRSGLTVRARRSYLAAKAGGGGL
jgi:Ca-activated chloride channel homolog